MKLAIVQYVAIASMRKEGGRGGRGGREGDLEAFMEGALAVELIDEIPDDFAVTLELYVHLLALLLQQLPDKPCASLLRARALQKV